MVLEVWQVRVLGVLRDCKSMSRLMMCLFLELMFSYGRLCCATLILLQLNGQTLFLSLSFFVVWVKQIVVSSSFRLSTYLHMSINATQHLM